MVDINIPIKLITQRYQYLLITPRAHPNKYSQVKRKETHKSPPAHLMGNINTRKNSLKRPPKITMGTIPNHKKSKKQAKR